MKQEDKQLLLIDLCARLPYLVKGLYQWKGNVPFDRELDGRLYDELYLSLYSTEDSSFKPYLRPMSSMTKEEEEEYELLIDCSDYTYFKTSDKVIDWLNKHYFDYRIDPSTGKTLIESGLAIEAPEGMYKTE